MPARLTMGSAAVELQQLLSRLQGAGAATVVLDGRGLEHFDSSAISVMLELRRLVLQRGGELRVVNLPPRLTDLMALYGVGELLPA